MQREKTLSMAHIASWDAIPNEIDDAMVRNLPITSIGVQYWLNRLSLCLQQATMSWLTETVTLPLRAKTEAVRNGVGIDDPVRMSTICQLAW